MNISFKHRIINGKSVFSKPVKVDYNILGAYNSYMMNGYHLVYINLDEYDENKCYIYYIKDFMKYYKNKIRKDKFKILLDETK